MDIKTVAVLGASGDLGQVIVPALLKAGFKVTAIIRPGGNYEKPDPTAAIKESPYDSISTLASAFSGQDAVIEAFNPAALVHQRTIVRAAIAAEVKHLITNEFGADTFHPNAKDMPILDAKVQAHRDLEEELYRAAAEGNTTALKWTGIITNVWYDFVMRRGFFWLDAKTSKILRYGSGHQKVSLSRVELNGEAVVAVLRNPERYSNRPAYFATHSVTTNELVAMAREVEPTIDWDVVDVPDVAGLWESGRQMWDEDTEAGVKDRLHSQAYVKLVLGAVFDEENSFGTYFGDKVEPGWGQNMDIFKEHLKESILQIRGSV